LIREHQYCSCKINTDSQQKNNKGKGKDKDSYVAWTIDETIELLHILMKMQIMGVFLWKFLFARGVFFSTIDGQQMIIWCGNVLLLTIPNCALQDVEKMKQLIT